MSDLTDFRSARDDFFAHDQQSPLTAEQRRNFHGLSYFHENPALTLDFEAEPVEPREHIEMQTSTGDVADFVRWVRVRFRIEGHDAALTIYRDPVTGGLFLPFRDATSGGETYGAGRYLEVHPADNDRLHVDFNYAYNPYCAYNERWSCPIPPEENRLAVPIRAGERTFEGDHQ